MSGPEFWADPMWDWRRTDQWVYDGSDEVYGVALKPEADEATVSSFELWQKWADGFRKDIGLTGPAIGWHI